MEGGIKLTKHPCFVFAVGQTQIGFPGKMVVDTGFSDTNLFCQVGIAETPEIRVAELRYPSGEVFCRK